MTASCRSHSFRMGWRDVSGVVDVLVDFVRKKPEVVAAAEMQKSPLLLDRGDPAQRVGWRSIGEQPCFWADGGLQRAEVDCGAIPGPDKRNLNRVAAEEVDNGRRIGPVRRKDDGFVSGIDHAAD